MREAVRSHIVQPGAFEFGLEAARSRFDKVHRGGDEDKVTVLSHERLAGTPHSGGYDAETIADRLAAVFPEAHVLVVVREQKSNILSSYLQYTRSGGTLSLERYLHPPQDTRVPGFSFGYFEYHKLVRHYRELFGKERVTILFYEELRQDPGSFVASLFTALDLPEPGPATIDLARQENVALSHRASGVKRALSRIASRRDTLKPDVLVDLGSRGDWLVEQVVSQFARLIPNRLEELGARRARALIEANVGGRYARSNRLLQELVGRDLTNFGYDVEA